VGGGGRLSDACLTPRMIPITVLIKAIKCLDIGAQHAKYTHSLCRLALFAVNSSRESIGSQKSVGGSATVKIMGGSVGSRGAREGGTRFQHGNVKDFARGMTRK